MNIQDHSKPLRISSFEYLIMFLFIVLSGFTAASVLPAKSYILSFLGIIYFIKKRQKQNTRFLIISILSYLIIGVIHYYIFNYVSTRCFIEIPLLIFSGYYVMDRLGYKFKYVYLNLMTIFSAISLFFFILMIITGYVPSLPIFHTNSYESIFIYNIRLNEIIDKRNCGPFWEPGAFAGYLIMVFALFFNQLNKLWIQYKIQCIILTMALFSTFSSQGYLSFALLIFLYYIRNRLNYAIIFKALFCVVIFFFAYLNIDFLRDKIDHQLKLAADWESNESLQSANRFSTTLLDYYYILKSPYIGNTDISDIRYGDHPFILKIIEDQGHYGSGSGISSLAAMYGIPMLFLWIFLVYLNFRRYLSKKESMSIFIVLFLLGFAEVYNFYIFYLSLPFLIITNSSKNINFQKLVDR